MTSNATVFVQSSGLFVVRALLYHTCHRVLGSLVQDLRHLSSSSPSTSNAPEESDLDDLPLPTTSSRSKPLTSSTSSSFVTSMPAGGFLAPSRSKGALTGAGSTGLSANFHSRTARAAFALCFEENIMLFLLVAAQSLNVLDERTLQLNWRISLTAVVALVMLVIPLLMAIFITYRWSSGSFQRRSIFVLIPYFIYLYAVTLIPNTSSPSSNDLPFPLPQALSRLALMGVLILGTLSGFGAIRNASILLSSLSLRRVSSKKAGKRRADDGAVTEEDVSHAEGSLRRVRADLEERRRQLVVAAAAGSGANESKASWMPRVFGGGDDLGGLRQEINGLEALEKQMARSLKGLQERRERDVFSRTMYGRSLNGALAVFGVYCMYRIFIASVNLILPWSRATAEASGAAPTDIVIRWLLVAFPSLENSLGLTPERAVSLSRQFSLLMVGAIVLSSVRLVLRGVNQVLRVSSKNLGASLMLLTLAQLMATYFLSTLIQLRTSFPPPPPESAVNSESISLFATLPQFEVFGPLFDLAFLLSAFVSALIRWLGGALSEEEPWGWEMVGVQGQTRR